MGKSHILTVAVARRRHLLEDAGFSVICLAEEVPDCADADDLWRRMAPSMGARWMDWDRHSRAGPKRALVVIEGFDRHLRALGSSGRKRLRALLDAHPQVWLVGTGARLPSELVEHDEAFYGFFQALPITPLEPADAYALLDHEVGELREDPRWQVRREVVLVLAGGNPRALVALARAVKDVPGETVARRLLAVLDEFTPHYQLRFKDLSPQEQRLIELLTLSPRELGPSEIAQHLGGSPAVWSSCAHRLDEHGVLRIRQEGRSAWYRMAEPLFRYWLEFRSGPWDATRVAWLGRLLEVVLGPDEIVETWNRTSDPTLKGALSHAVRSNARARELAWADRFDAVWSAIQAQDQRAVIARIGEAAQVAPNVTDVWWLASQVASTHFISDLSVLAQPLTRGGCPTLGALIAGKSKARNLLKLLLKQGTEELKRVDGLHPLSVQAVVALLDLAIRRTDPRGGRWVLTADERRSLRDSAILRARFSRSGRRRTDPPLLVEPDLLQASLTSEDPDLADLLWVSVARGWDLSAARTLAILSTAEDMDLPWCPWPGRALPLDTDQLVTVMARKPSVAALSWLGASGTASADSFRDLLLAIAAQKLPVPAGTGSGTLDIALAALGLVKPERLEDLGRALGAEWGAPVDRARLLVRQVQEGRRGPLHPELARIRDALAQGRSIHPSRLHSSEVSAPKSV
jgi:hypothetical protein